MISPSDLLVVIVAVGIVLAFVFAVRRFIQHAQQHEAAEDDHPLPASNREKSSDP
jgi:uncharacterized membrane protein YqiK